MQSRRARIGRSPIPLAMALIASVLASPAVPMQWQDLTAEDAQAIVTAFEGAGPIEFQSVETEQSEMTYPPCYFVASSEYKLEAADGSRRYTVSRWWQHHLRFYDLRYAHAWVGGEFPEQWEAYYGHPYSSAELLALQMPIEDAQQIGTSYAQAHYPAFGVLNSLRSGPTKTTSWGFVPSFWFTFYYMTDTGAQALDQCHVHVDSVLGEIVEYRQTYFPIEVSTTPLVTADEACQIACGTMMEPGATVVSVWGPSVLAPDALGMERLSWIVTVEGYKSVDGSIRYGQYVGYVDAHTGELIFYDILMAPAVKRPRPLVKSTRTKPRADVKRGLGDAGSDRSGIAAEINGMPASLAYGPRLNGTPFLYARYLAAFGAQSFGYERRRVYVITSRGEVKISVGDPSVLIGSRRTTYDTAPINIRGRVYLPLSMFRDLAGADITYDPAAKRLKISGVRRARFLTPRAASPQ